MDACRSKVWTNNLIRVMIAFSIPSTLQLSQGGRALRGLVMLWRCTQPSALVKISI